MEQDLCKICNENQAKYCCPRCNYPYCSLSCYKSPIHSQCMQSFHQTSLSTLLHNERATEQDKRAILAVIHRMSQFDEDSNDFEAEESDPFSKLAAEDLEAMSVEQIESILGPEEMRRFHSQFTASNEQLADLALSYKPWWIAEKIQILSDNQPASPASLLAPLENLCSIASLSKTAPSNFLWNNLVELFFIYAYLHRLYIGQVEENLEEMCKVYVKFSKVLSHNYVYETAINAIQTPIFAVLHDEQFGNPSIFVVLVIKDLIELLRRPSSVFLALCHIYRLIESQTSRSRDLVPVSRKIYFYCAWINDEITHQPGLVEQVFASIVAILEGTLVGLEKNASD